MSKKKLDIGKATIVNWRTYSGIKQEFYDLESVLMGESGKNVWYENYDPENNEGDVSLTVPDMTFSITTLLDRYTRGQAIPTPREGFGYDDPDEVPLDLPDIEKMDKLGKLDLASDLREEVEVIQKRRKKRKKVLEAEPVSDDDKEVSPGTTPAPAPEKKE